MTKDITSKIASLLGSRRAGALPSALSARQAGLAGAAIGSAAIAAALLFASRRRNSTQEPPKAPPVPGGEPPETD